MVRQVKSWETCVQLGIAAVAVVVTSDASAKAAPVAPAPASTLTTCRSTSTVPPTSAQIGALQALVLKYGVVDSVNKTTMTRCQFASLLNALGNQVNELIASGYAELVSKKDLSTFQRLQEAFAVEYLTFAGAGSPATQEDLPPQQSEALYRAGFAVSRLRIDALEAMTKKQEQPPFLPTTKLHVETILEISGSAGRNR